MTEHDSAVDRLRWDDAPPRRLRRTRLWAFVWVVAAALPVGALAVVGVRLFEARADRDVLRQMAVAAVPDGAVVLSSRAEGTIQATSRIGQRGLVTAVTATAPDALLAAGPALDGQWRETEPSPRERAFRSGDGLLLTWHVRPCGGTPACPDGGSVLRVEVGRYWEDGV